MLFLFVYLDIEKGNTQCSALEDFHSLQDVRLEKAAAKVRVAASEWERSVRSAQDAERRVEKLERQLEKAKDDVVKKIKKADAKEEELEKATRNLGGVCVDVTMEWLRFKRNTTPGKSRGKGKWRKTHGSCTSIESSRGT